MTSLQFRTCLLRRFYQLGFQTKTTAVLPTHFDLTHLPFTIKPNQSADLHLNMQATNVQININNDTKLERKLTIGNANFSRIIGHNGKIRQQIENESGAELIIPGRNSTIDDITVRGSSEEILDHAERCVQNVLNPNATPTTGQMQRPQTRAPKLPAYTHFLSLPLNTEEAKNELVKLYDVIQNQIGTSKDYEPSLFMKPVRFHVTLLMLRVHDQQTKQQIKQIMGDQIAPLVANTFDVTDHLILDRIATFAHSSPEKTRVLFFEAMESGTLQKLHQLVAEMKQIFFDKGLITEAEKDETWKFHATIMNAKYRALAESKMQQNKKRWGLKPRPIDGTSIIARFGTRCDGMADLRIPLRTVELSSLSFGKVQNADLLFYPCEHKLEFPK
jgi:2'-5' RNA ligase